MRLPEYLYRAGQVRELDRIAIAERGLSGGVLMQRAGEAVFTLLRERWPRARRLVVVCGSGNNGGDGYVVAHLAAEAGLMPRVMAVGAKMPTGDAAAARQACEAAGVVIRPFEAGGLVRCDIVVDALLGTGLEREVDHEWRAIIEAVNRAGLPVLAVDIASGLNADTGEVLGVAVRAETTVTFIGLKAGLFTGAGREHSGEIFFTDLGVPADIYPGINPCARRLTEAGLQNLLPPRARHSHKGNLGHVMVLGGDRGMAGAPRLAGAAAYRAGCGLVTVATHPAHVSEVSTACPELLAYGIATPQDLRQASARATVLAVGPGLGQDEWGRRHFTTVMESSLPKIMDADGLNLLARDPMTRMDWILTPHPGEAGRLLGTDALAVQQDRFAAVGEIARRYGGVCVLKGSGTLIAGADDDIVDLCDRGNPGMASGGMGDVLTGVIAALLAQGLKAREAARLSVWLHAAAGDAAAGRAGEIGLVASDLLPFIRLHLNQMVGHANV
jgi:ADP-dependent NAD(P)H-hydrate dehydratase / NAD(P)H-hydrate epimerase